MSTHQRFSQLSVNKNEDPLLAWIPKSGQVEQGLTFINFSPESSFLKVILSFPPLVQNCSLDSEQQVTTLKYNRRNA